MEQKIVLLPTVQWAMCVRGFTDFTRQGWFFCFAIFFKTEDLGLEMHSGQHSVKPEKYLMGFWCEKLFWTVGSNFFVYLHGKLKKSGTKEMFLCLLRMIEKVRKQAKASK